MSRKHLPRLQIIALLAVAVAMLPAVGVTQAPTFDAGGLAAERERWQAAGIDDYRYVYQKYCECYRGEPPVTVVAVRDGRAEQVRHRYRDADHEVAVDAASAEFYWTIDELFDRMARAIERDALVRAEFDAELGYPTSIFIDDDPDTIGDEMDFRAIEVELPE